MWFSTFPPDFTSEVRFLLLCGSARLETGKGWDTMDRAASKQSGVLLHCVTANLLQSKTFLMLAVVAQPVRQKVNQPCTIHLTLK